MGVAVRSIGVFFLGYPILLALVALVVLVGTIAILKFFVYDPIAAERARKEAAKIEELRDQEWRRKLLRRAFQQIPRIKNVDCC